MKRLAREVFVAAIAAFTSIILAAHNAAAQTRTPNIVIIVADDMGYADIGVHGGRDIPTPWRGGRGGGDGR